MVDIPVSNDDLTIITGPETIELLLDIGAQGTRGSRIFSGTDTPTQSNTTFGSEVAKVGDYYINTSIGNAESSYLYEFMNVPTGQNPWEAKLKISPTILSKRVSVTFANGIGDIIIPFSEISASSIDTLTADKFNVQYAIIDVPSSGTTPQPIASAITTTKSATSPYSLNVKIAGTIYDPTAGTWSKLAKGVIVQLFVSII